MAVSLPKRLRAEKQYLWTQLVTESPRSADIQYTLRIEEQGEFPKARPNYVAQVAALAAPA
jgi:hypothetical protein